MRLSPRCRLAKMKRPRNGPACATHQSQVSLNYGLPVNLHGGEWRRHPEGKTTAKPREASLCHLFAAVMI